MRIWFNYWFRTAYSIISILRSQLDEDNCNYTIIGSHTNEYSPIQKVCDEWYIEESSSENYVEFCLNFCKEHKIDIFVPYRNMEDISGHKELFEEIGVKILSDKCEYHRLFEKKSTAYKFFADNKILNIPEYYTVNTVEEFKTAYSDLQSKYESVCIKFVKDKGGQSFRRIAEENHDFNSLRYYGSSSRISFEKICKILSQKERFDDMIVMPYLSGIEVSVDCLQTSGGLIALPRFKGENHLEYLRFDDEILSMTHEVLTKVPMEYPCDVQFKYLGDKPYLLEVNTRMSGGLPMSYEASGVNIPYLALKKVMGEEIRMPKYEMTEKIFSNVEIPIVVK